MRRCKQHRVFSTLLLLLPVAQEDYLIDGHHDTEDIGCMGMHGKMRECS